MSLKAVLVLIKIFNTLDVLQKFESLKCVSHCYFSSLRFMIWKWNQENDAVFTDNN